MRRIPQEKMRCSPPPISQEVNSTTGSVYFTSIRSNEYLRNSFDSFPVFMKFDSQSPRVRQEMMSAGT